MPEITEVLVCQSACSFVVDTAAVPKRKIIANAGSSILQNANGNTMFQYADSLVLLSAGLVFPEAFVMYIDGSNFPYFTFAYSVPRVPPPNDNYSIPSLAGGNVIIPMENYEVAVDSFIDVTNCPHVPPLHPQTYMHENARLLLGVLGAWASMYNVPASLNGTTQYVMPFIKIRHTIPIFTP